MNGSGVPEFYNCAEWKAEHDPDGEGPSLIMSVTPGLFSFMTGQYIVHEKDQ